MRVETTTAYSLVNKLNSQETALPTFFLEMQNCEDSDNDAFIIFPTTFPTLEKRELSCVCYINHPESAHGTITAVFEPVNSMIRTRYYTFQFRYLFSEMDLLVNDIILYYKKGILPFRI